MSQLLKNKKMVKKIMHIYKDYGQDVVDGISKLEKKYKGSKKETKRWVCEKDVMLITYGDSIKRDGGSTITNSEELF